MNPGAALKFVFHWRGPRLFFFQEAKMGFDRSGVDAMMEITNRPELVFVRGRGSWLEDHNGKRSLDFVQGWAGNFLCHCHAPVVAAMREQSATLTHPPQDLSTPTSI